MPDLACPQHHFTYQTLVAGAFVDFQTPASPTSKTTPRLTTPSLRHLLLVLCLPSRTTSSTNIRTHSKRIHAIMAVFNRLTTTVSELQDLLHEGKSTSVDALTAYLEQIDAQDSWLKAVIATPPRRQLFERAKLLDGERRQGKTRGPLHGIPILIKVATASVFRKPRILTSEGRHRHSQSEPCDHRRMLLARRNKSSARC